MTRQEGKLDKNCRRLRDKSELQKIKDILQQYIILKDIKLLHPYLEYMDNLEEELFGTTFSIDLICIIISDNMHPLHDKDKKRLFYHMRSILRNFHIR